MDRDEFINGIAPLLDDIQETLFQRAVKFRADHSLSIDSNKAFYKLFTKAKGYENGAFVYAHWCGSKACEEKIKKDLSVTIRCIPFDSPEEAGACICCGEDSGKRVLFAKAY
jgi:prolyl-tRNA synthetase